VSAQTPQVAARRARDKALIVGGVAFPFFAFARPPLDDHPIAFVVLGAHLGRGQLRALRAGPLSRPLENGPRGAGWKLTPLWWSWSA